jgi:hypothetical protein
MVEPVTAAAKLRKSTDRAHSGFLHGWVQHYEVEIIDDLRADESVTTNKKQNMCDLML